MATGSRTRAKLPLPKEVIDLTSDTEEDINRNNPGTEKKAINIIAGNPITEYHIGILQGDHWLNDEIINSYLYIVQCQHTDVCALSTFFHPKLCKEGPSSESLRRWLKPVSPISSRRLVLVPINLGNTHWALVAYHVSSRVLSYYDSMMHLKSGMRILAQYKAVFQYLHDEEDSTARSDRDDLADLLRQLNLDSNQKKAKDITLYIPAGQARQLDGSSCGVFVCKWAQYLVLRPDGLDWGKTPPFTQKDVTMHRLDIIDILCKFKNEQ